MAAVNICSDLGAQENKICHCFHFFPICLPWRSTTPYVPLCLSLNSFCYETSRTWASFGPETRCVTSVGRSWALAEFKSWPCGFKSQTGFFYRLKIGTFQEHLPVTEQQQGHLPSASEDTEPCAAAAADFWHNLKVVQGGEWGTLCSRKNWSTIFR